jgi:hypothetical protein
MANTHNIKFRAVRRMTSTGIRVIVEVTLSAATIVLILTLAAHAAPVHGRSCVAGFTMTALAVAAASAVRPSGSWPRRCFEAGRDS